MWIRDVSALKVDRMIPGTASTPVAARLTLFATHERREVRVALGSLGSRGAMSFYDPLRIHIRPWDP